MHRAFTIIFAVILFCASIVLLLGFGIQMLAAETFAGGEYGAPLKLYSNIDSGVTVRYPDGFSVNSAYVYDGLGKEKRIGGVSFTVPKDKTVGTNLSPDTKVTVEIIPGTPHCSARMFLRDSKNIKPLLDGEESYSFGFMKEHAAGSMYEEDVFAVPESSPCVAIRYFIHSTNIGNYPAGTVKEFNRGDLLAAFDVVRRSLSVVAK